MNYNISFDIATIAILSVMLVALRTIFYTSSQQSAVFRKFIAFTLFNALIDIITAFTIAYSGQVPDWLNIILNSIYQYISAFTVYFAIRYVFVYLDCANNVNKVINHIIGFSYIALLTVNIFTGLIFTFKDHAYIHGPLFLATYVLSFLAVIHAGITVVIHRRQFEKLKYRIVVFFLTLPIVFSVTQMFVGDVLLTAFGEAFAAMIMLFSLETPDYNKLLSTLDELEAARQEADIANNSKSDFLANMSHEIRTPINGILGMDTMILRECDDPQIIEYAENIKIAGNGLLSIINDILDLSKIESGKMELSSEKYELFSIINDCYQMVRMRAEEKGLKLTFKNNPDLPSMLLGDEVRIRQIINNLLSNSIKYTSQGQVVVSLDFEKYTGITAVNDKSRIWLIIKVEDTGIGIKDEDKAKLFESFTRLEQSRNRNIEGTGLGLKITKQLVSMMSGSIDVESEYGKGSVFTVRVLQEVSDQSPMGDLDKAFNERQSVSHQKEDDFTAPGANILVVDDVKMNIIVFKGLLKGTEISIDTAASGKECLKMTAEKKYNAIFMDHLMPEMDGIETYHNMLNSDNNLNKETPVIVLTANAIVGAKEMYLNEGFCSYLTKPVERDTLISTIKELKLS